MKPDVMKVLNHRRLKTDKRLHAARQEQAKRSAAVQDSKLQIQKIQAAIGQLRRDAVQASPVSPAALLGRRDQDAAFKKTLQGLLNVHSMLQLELQKVIETCRKHAVEQTKLHHKTKVLECAAQATEVNRLNSLDQAQIEDLLLQRDPRASQ